MKIVTRRQRTKARVRTALTVMTFFSLLTFPLSRPVEAAALSSGRDHTSRQMASLTSGVDHTVAFTTSSSNGTEAKVQIRFDDASDGLWCATAGADLVVTTSTEDSATGLPGTLTAACTQGAGASSYDTITVSGVSDLSISTRYGVKISDGTTGKLGTPGAGTFTARLATLTSGDAVIDSQNISLAIIANDQVSVSATVDPSITAALDTTTAALGTLSTTSVSKAAVVSTVTTNAQNGFTSSVNYNNKLRIDVSNDINDTTGGTIVAGTEEFGVSTSEATGVDIGVWSPASCTSGATTSNATALTAAAQTFAAAAAPVSADATTLCFLASIAGTTAAGAYSNTVTVVTTARY